jgi:hypothetical protein
LASHCGPLAVNRTPTVMHHPLPQGDVPLPHGAVRGRVDAVRLLNGIAAEIQEL